MKIIRVSYFPGLLLALLQSLTFPYEAHQKKRSLSLPSSFRKMLASPVPAPMPFLKVSDVPLCPNSRSQTGRTRCTQGLVLCGFPALRNSLDRNRGSSSTPATKTHSFGSIKAG